MKSDDKNFPKKVPETFFIGKLNRKGVVEFDMKKEHLSYGEALIAIDKMPTENFYHIQKFYKGQK